MWFLIVLLEVIQKGNIVVDSKVYIYAMGMSQAFFKPNELPVLKQWSLWPPSLPGLLNTFGIPTQPLYGLRLLEGKEKKNTCLFVKLCWTTWNASGKTLMNLTTTPFVETLAAWNIPNILTKSSTVIQF